MNATLSRREKETRNRKDALRIAMRRTRRMLSLAHRRDASRRACAHLLAMPAVGAAGAVAVYSAIRREVDPADAVEALWRRGQTVVFPRVVEGKRALRFHAVHSRAELAPGQFGIASPTAECAEVSLSAIDVAVIPGLAFDARGYRLGWGRGHYDATLAGFAGLRIGFAYHSQLVARVPESDHDQPMDFLVTDAGVMAIGRPASDQALSPAPGQAPNQASNRAPHPRGPQDTE